MAAGLLDQLEVETNGEKAKLTNFVSARRRER